jgi:hypothetical protein
MYAPDVVTFAQANGLWSGESCEACAVYAQYGNNFSFTPAVAAVFF